jgi:hypothetical protein
MRTALLSGFVLAAALAAGGAQAADQAGCQKQEQEYAKRLKERVMPADQHDEYMGIIAGGLQACVAGDANPWENIEGKLPAKL